MRQFKHSQTAETRFRNDPVVDDLRTFRQSAGAIAFALEMPGSLKPEVSLLLELFEAEKMGKRLTVSMLGLIDGIPPTTTLRYIDLLENCGALARIPHETDNRMRYVELLPEARKAIEEAIASLRPNRPTSDKQTK
ncbi:hypothetical protein INR77_04680 [Erythrobacter sp. SCSIO 43205]|uniref:hypothetical protein n=1 Tax=Erythrobacter sp. SCSIO 43205 TaxID=2779361 RepID=UPI001CA88FF8|nr:hypothetical protein [Erythrobacter sp. SCSIO 43205]UAB78996.1 hypothetical protein INR77_04680 [Erythrobacter sp. SCSIO 43205]